VAQGADAGSPEGATSPGFAFAGLVQAAIEGPPYVLPDAELGATQVEAASVVVGSRAAAPLAAR
jgi:hypothetical protein